MQIIVENEYQLQPINAQVQRNIEELLFFDESATRARVLYEQRMREMCDRQYLNYMFSEKEIEEQIELQNKLKEETENQNEEENTQKVLESLLKLKHDEKIEKASKENLENVIKIFEDKVDDVTLEIVDETLENIGDTTCETEKEITVIKNKNRERTEDTQLVSDLDHEEITINFIRKVTDKRCKRLKFMKKKGQLLKNCS